MPDQIDDDARLTDKRINDLTDGIKNSSKKSKTTGYYDEKG